MVRAKLFGAALLASAWLMLPGIASAHRMNSAMSLIEISPTSGKLQVTHRLFAHDLEGALGAGSVDLAWFETSRGKAALRDYCLALFVVQGPNNRPIPLTFVGIELDGATISVYFEGRRPRVRYLIVDSNFLQEMSESQVNQVNVRANGRTVSAVFQAGAPARQLALP
jgi:hypothetical protein